MERGDTPIIKVIADTTMRGMLCVVTDSHRCGVIKGKPVVIQMDNSRACIYVTRRTMQRYGPSGKAVALIRSKDSRTGT